MDNEEVPRLCSLAGVGSGYRQGKLSLLKSPGTTSAWSSQQMALSLGTVMVAQAISQQTWSPEGLPCSLKAEQLLSSGQEAGRGWGPALTMAESLGRRGLYPLRGLHGDPSQDSVQGKDTPSTMEEPGGQVKVGSRDPWCDR